jgi:HAD superfamily hydrolase (TIGR01549 family)
MTRTLLLDLDDTLLGNSMDTFMPAYLQSLVRRLSPFGDPARIARQLIAATNLMYQNQEPGCTLEQVFDRNFFPALGLKREDVQAAIDDFYALDFPQLSSVVTPRPEAVEMVEEAQRRGYRLAIATAPLFPLTAIQQRLRWAGLAPEEFDFALIPDYSSFHFSKPNSAYFAELLGQIGWPDDSVVMVGDNLEHDIDSARKIGLPVFWIHNGRNVEDETTRSVPQGSIADLLPWLDSQADASLRPDFNQPQALISILRATPATLATLFSRAGNEKLSVRPQPDSWCPTEVVCHLRDVEGEVNLPRVQKVLREVNPFVPGRETDQWAEIRDYIHQDGWQALEEFRYRRLSLLSNLVNLSPDEWALPARHAIFGPTTFQELVKFIADHDRLHIQQVFEAIFPKSNPPESKR